MSADQELQRLLRQYVDGEPDATPQGFMQVAIAAGHAQAVIVAWSSRLVDAAIEAGAIDEATNAALFDRLNALDPARKQKALTILFGVMDLDPEAQDAELQMRLAATTVQLGLVNLELEAAAAFLQSQSIPSDPDERARLLAVFNRGVLNARGARDALRRMRDQLQKALGSGT
jgi:hypothetical protein